MPVFRIGKQDAGKESAQRHGNAHLVQQPCRAQHHQQGACREHFRNLRACSTAEQRAQQQPPTDDDGSDNKHLAQHVQHVRQCAGRCVPGGKQWHQGQDGNRCHVLQQQDGECEPAMSAVQLLAFGKDLQADGRRRQGQGQAHHDGGFAQAGTGGFFDDGGFPADAEQQGSRGKRQRAAHHLRRAPAEYLSAHQPEPLRGQLQSDHEQHQDHAEFGNLRDFVGIADQVEQGRADQGTGREIAKHRTEPRTLGQRHGNHGSQQQHQGILKEAAGFQGSLHAGLADYRTRPACHRFVAADNAESFSLAVVPARRFTTAEWLVKPGPIWPIKTSHGLHVETRPSPERGCDQRCHEPLACVQHVAALETRRRQAPHTHGGDPCCLHRSV